MINFFFENLAFYEINWKYFVERGKPQIIWRMPIECWIPNGGYTLVTLPRIVTPYRDNVDGTRARVTYQKLVTR
jgi:hypothetical protein